MSFSHGLGALTGLPGLVQKQPKAPPCSKCVKKGAGSGKEIIIGVAKGQGTVLEIKRRVRVRVYIVECDAFL
jgi:hypothetical protein